jgi:hypothetical protein
VETLMDENKRLFAEQISDHIEKLNELMVCASGDAVDEANMQRVCLATKLLEGSTGMLGFDTWSRTLGAFKKLLGQALKSGRHWDEHLSQVVSELLETEEQVAAEIMSGDFEERVVVDSFEGLYRETEVFLEEAYGGGDQTECSLEFKPLNSESGDAPALHQGDSSILDTLIDSLNAVRDAFGACVRNRDRRDSTISGLARAIGESEFLFAIVRDIISHAGSSHRTFIPRVASCTIMDGIRDFFDVHVRLRDWRAELETRSDDVVLDGEIARALAVILERCLFDVCMMYEGRIGFDLGVAVDISNHGSFLETRVTDNGTDFLSDTEIENYDAAAYYKGLLCVRGLLERWGGLLWVEPDRAGGERFRFTIPCSVATREYRIIEASGVNLAIPCQSVEDILEPGDDGIVYRGGDRYIEWGELRIPVYRIDEIAVDQMDACTDGDRIVIVGLAEKRVALFMRGDGSIVEGIADQLTEGNWACLSTRYLHMGEEEYPVLDAKMLLERIDYLKQLDRVPVTSGSLPMNEEVDDIDDKMEFPRVQVGTD